MYTITLTRDHIGKEVSKNHKNETSIIGHFEVKDEDDNIIFSCYSLENSGAPTDLMGLDRPIIPRSYTLHWAESSVCVPKAYRGITKQKLNKAIWLHDPNNPKFARRRIMIHIGNDAIDTLGCILLGAGYNKDSGKITDSTKAIAQFYSLCESKGIENFRLNIIGLKGGQDA